MHSISLNEIRIIKSDTHACLALSFESWNSQHRRVTKPMVTIIFLTIIQFNSCGMRYLDDSHNDYTRYHCTWNVNKLLWVLLSTKRLPQMFCRTMHCHTFALFYVKPKICVHLSWLAGDFCALYESIRAGDESAGGVLTSPWNLRSIGWLTICRVVLSVLFSIHICHLIGLAMIEGPH